MATLTRYQPETPVTRLPDIIDKLFRESFVVPTYWDRLFDGKPSLNLIENDYMFYVRLAVPGIDVEKLEINVVGTTLTVKAPIMVPTFDEAVYLFHGLTADEFSQVFTLPADVDGTKAEAKYELGILTITLPKAEHAKPMRVKISTVK